MYRSALMVALVALSRGAWAGPVFGDDFEAYEVGSLPGAPWEDIADSIRNPTLPAPTGQIIGTTGPGGLTTQAYQIFQAKGTSQGIIVPFAPASTVAAEADMRVDIHPSPTRFSNWTSALGLFQDLDLSDINNCPQAVVYVYDERWYFFGATNPNQHFVNELLSDAPVLAGEWHHVGLVADTQTGEFSIRITDESGLVDIDRTVQLPGWDPSLGRYDRLAAFDGEYARGAVTPGQFTVDNISLVPGPGSSVVLAAMGMVVRRRRRSV